MNVISRNISRMAGSEQATLRAILFQSKRAARHQSTLLSIELQPRDRTHKTANNVNSQINRRNHQSGTIHEADLSSQQCESPYVLNRK